MSPHSSTSSTEAHHGSATSNSGYRYISITMFPSSFRQTNTYCSNQNRLTETGLSASYYADAPQSHYPYGQQSAFSTGPAPTSQNTNGTSNNMARLTNGSTLHTTSPHCDQVAPGRNTNPSTSHGTYFPQYAYDTYSHSATTYANELTLEDDQTQASTSATTTTYSYQQSQETQTASQYAWNPSNNVPQTTDEAYHGEVEVQNPWTYPPTTRRWSTEYSPDECIRLGIPHYTTQAQRCRLSDHTACDHEPIDPNHPRL